MPFDPKKMESEVEEKVARHISHKKCACKGIRTCAICETSVKQEFNNDQNKVRTKFWYCQDCKKAWTSSSGQHPHHSGNSIDFEGIYIQEGFLSEEEERAVAEEIYRTPFVNSQSGRRKQDYGPKVNFKRRKVKMAGFTGLPSFSADLYKRMLCLDILSSFVPVEQCHLEYTPERGSAIDPHYDDFWIWGERLVTINLLSDTVLYFISDELPRIEVCVPMQRMSLIVVYGKARHKWKHAIHRNDITLTRLAVTLRELSEEFTDHGDRSEEGMALLKTALTFNGTAVGAQNL